LRQYQRLAILPGKVTLVQYPRRDAYNDSVGDPDHGGRAIALYHDAEAYALIALEAMEASALRAEETLCSHASRK
jgi:hypothetical protein